MLALLFGGGSRGLAQGVIHFNTSTSIPVGNVSPIQHVPLHIETAITSIRVLTQGSENLDFANAGTGSCTTLLTPPADCTVDVTFTPSAPGRRKGAVVLLGSGNTVIASQMLDGIGAGPLAVIRSGRTDSFAGSGEWIYRADDIPAASAQVWLPRGVVGNGAGDIFLSDSGNNRIRRVSAADGIIHTIAGTGTPSNAGDGGPALSAGVSSPTGLAMDGAGNLYIADFGNHAIRRIDAVTGVISTVAGKLQTPGYTGDGALATAATLDAPNAVAFDVDGNMYIVDTGNDVVRRVDAKTQIITTVAGTGKAGYIGDGGPATSATLNTPFSLAFGPDGSYYIADLANHVIRRVDITTNTISTAVGNGAQDFLDNVKATEASLNGPTAVTFDPAGNLYIADSTNNRVRRVDAQTQIITTIAGNGDTAPLNDTFGADLATLSGPYGLYLDAKANIFIADQFNNKVRRILSNDVNIRYPDMKVGKTSATQVKTMENDGLADSLGSGDLKFGTIEFDQASLDSSKTTCGSTAIQVSGTCDFGLQFTPKNTGSPVQGKMTVPSNASNSADTFEPYGNVLAVEPTSVTLKSSLNPATVDQSITFTAAVASDDPDRSGTVDFYDGTTQIGTATLSSGVATLVVKTLTLGEHSIVAKYSGDDKNAASDSTALVEKILQSATLTVDSSQNPSVATHSVTFTASITGSNSKITSGTVNFFDGTTKIGSGTITSAGIATFAISTLTVGSHNITAGFDGDSVSFSGTSPVLVQKVDLASTETLLSANPGSITLGESVALTATVSSAEGPAPTGTVVFTADTLSLGSSTVTDGKATISSTSLPVGTAHILATYSGDSSDATSKSTTISVVVKQISTETTLISSANPSNAGSSLQLTATVISDPTKTAVGTITGTFTFYDGSTILGTAPVSANGTAIYTTSAFTVNTHALTAVYGGNTNYSASTSKVLSQAVHLSETSTSLAVSASTLVAGKSLTLSSTVTTSGVKATGTVTFLEGSTVLGQATLNNNAIATVSLTTLSVGEHTIVAKYVGDLNYNASTSAASTVAVHIGTTGLTLAPNATQITSGQSLTLSSTLTTDGVLPSGAAIQIRDNGNTIATLTLPASGTVSYSTSSLAVGTHSFTAVYTGDTGNAAATSTVQTVVVQKANSSVSLSTSQTPSVVAAAVVLRAVVTSSAANPSGTVQYFDGGAAIGTAPLDASGVASISVSNLAVGIHTLTAVYGGDTTHLTNTSGAVSQRVVQPTSLSVASNSNPSIAGLGVIFTADIAKSGSNTSTALAPTGTVTFLDGASVLNTTTISGNTTVSFSTSSLTVGTHSITVSYSGDSNFQASTSSVLTQVVKSADTAVALSASTTNAAYGSTIALTARVTGNGSTLSGTVVFLDGSGTIGTSALSSDGTAALATSALAPGYHVLTARYSGDKNNGIATSGTVQVQVRQTAQVTLASSSNPALTLDKITLTASVQNPVAPAATGTVDFREGSTLLGTATLNANGLASLQVGPFAAATHNFTATYSGDDRSYPGTSAALAVQVNLRATTNALTATASSLASNGVLSLISVLQYNGSTVPTGTTTFTSNGTVLGTSRLDSVGVATLSFTANALPSSVTATYSGDSVYAGSVSPAVSFSLTSDATAFTIVVDPTTVTVPRGKYVKSTVTIHSLGGFSDTLNLGCLGLPYAATCTFDKNQIKLEADGTATAIVTIDTGSPLTSGGQAKLETESHGGSTLALCSLPATALLGFLLLRSRRKAILPTLLMLLALAAVILPMSGCGTIDMSTTPAGSYTFQVSVSGQNTGVTLSQSVDMTVTQ